MTNQPNDNSSADFWTAVIIAVIAGVVILASALLWTAGKVPIP